MSRRKTTPISSIRIKKQSRAPPSGIVSRPVQPDLPSEGNHKEVLRGIK